MNKLFNFIRQSNRWKHLIGGFIIGVIGNDAYCSIYAGAIAASCLEYKDKTYGGKWDWIDWAMTTTGSIIGMITRLIFNLIFK